ncbi:hypothetical protein HHK36_008669 [Tetracentron sinense]|uniref:Dirigent protein n=1 Tax=Tetracentron sinense TaxID=13715 RepID=A0A834ZN21_TETSI|nr:hypothetical protein HHK36_008669 [Tetracentron sinense]
MGKLAVAVMLISLVVATPAVQSLVDEPDPVHDQVSWFENLRVRKEKVTQLHSYLHDILSGKKPTAMRVAQAAVTNKSPTLFGMVIMADDPLTEGPEATSKLLGRAQGLYGLAAQGEMVLIMAMSYGFTDEKYNGSSLSILGRNLALHHWWDRCFPIGSWDCIIEDALVSKLIVEGDWGILLNIGNAMAADSVRMNLNKFSCMYVGKATKQQMPMRHQNLEGKEWTVNFSKERKLGKAVAQVKALEIKANVGRGGARKGAGYGAAAAFGYPLNLNCILSALGSQVARVGVEKMSRNRDYEEVNQQNKQRFVVNISKKNYKRVVGLWRSIERKVINDPT